jgi:hypothetical protein
LMGDAPVLNLVPVVKLDLRVIFHGAAVVCSLNVVNVNPAVAAAPSLATGRRSHYTPVQQTALVAAAAGQKSTSLRGSVRHINDLSGFEKVSATMVIRWAKQADAPHTRKPKGPQPHIGFEAEVIQELIYQSVAEVDNPDEACIIANVAYSYFIVQAAARMVPSMPQWAGDAKVQALKFSQAWIHAFLNRARIFKRKITAADKPRQADPQVQEIMQGIQDLIKEKQLTAGQVWSMDEVGCLYGVSPDHTFVPRSAERATAPVSDNRSRFTFMLAGSAAGEMMPAYGIGKCGTNAADMSRTRVLHNLLKESEFATGWTLKWWERTLTLRGKKKDEYFEKKYLRPYLINMSGAVITIQHKAWMDTVCLIMYIDLVAGPCIKAAGGGLIIWDSCGPHGTAACKAVIEEWGLLETKLLVNMTGLLSARPAHCPPCTLPALHTPRPTHVGFTCLR